MSSCRGVDKVRCARMVLVQGSPQSVPTKVKGAQISLEGEEFAAEINTGSGPAAAVSFCGGWTSFCTDRKRVVLSDTVDSTKFGRNEWMGSVVWRTCSEGFATVLILSLFPTSYLDDHFNGRLYPGHSKRLRVHWLHAGSVSSHLIRCLCTQLES